MNPKELFWNEFRMLSGKLTNPPDKNAMDHLLVALKRVDDRLYYHLGSHNRGTDVIISAEGNPELLPVVEALRDLAPKLDGWGVVACFDGMFLFGQRDFRIYPHDENGDTIYRFVRGGDRPWIQRPINFSVVFPTYGAAIQFESELHDGEKKISEYDGAEGFTHEVEVTKIMHLTHKGISDFEKQLQLLAAKFAGRNDGWGCFMMKS